MKIVSVKARLSNPTAHTRIYIWPIGESLVKNMNNRRNRPYVRWKKEVLPEVLAKYNLSTSKISWSRKAGCRCGCSPGFIVKDARGFDIHVEVSDDQTDGQGS